MTSQSELSDASTREELNAVFVGRTVIAVGEDQLLLDDHIDNERGFSWPREHPTT